MRTPCFAAREQQPSHRRALPWRSFRPTMIGAAGNALDLKFDATQDTTPQRPHAKRKGSECVTGSNHSFPLQFE